MKYLATTLTIISILSLSILVGCSGNGDTTIEPVRSTGSGESSGNAEPSERGEESESGEHSMTKALNRVKATKSPASSTLWTISMMRLGPAPG